MNLRNLLPKMCLAILIFAGLYLAAILVASNLFYSQALGDWAFGPGIVTTSVVLRVLPGLAVLANVLLAIVRAVPRKDYVWLLGSVILWPLSFWYTLVETRPGANNSFKGMPLRGTP